MTDQPPKEPDDFGSVGIDGENEGQETIFNSEIGDDWGEAFEAEDFMFSPDEGEDSSFFLKDDSFEDSISPAEEKQSQQAASSPKPTPSVTHADNEPLIEQVTTVESPLTLPLRYCNQIKERFFAASLPVRIAAIAGQIALLAIFYYLSSSLTPEKEIQLPSQEIAQNQSPQTNTPESSQTPLPETAGDKTAAKPSPPSSTRHIQDKSPKAPDMGEGQNNKPKVTDKGPQTPSKPVQEKTRKKWKLKSFLISAGSGSNNKEPSFVAIDLTFVLLMDADDLIPEDKEIYIRELIYQFFNNRPLDELQRYALARGEMNRKLKAWVVKQWPDIPLSAIAFDHYQVL